MSVVEAKPTGRDCQARRLGKALVWMKRCPAILFTLVLYVACAAAQEQLDQVHVNSRTLSLSEGSGPPVFRSTADLVLVNVAVVDRAGRAVTGLQAGDFRLLDDNALQQLRYFWTQDESLSLMIVLDASASMGAKLDLARDAVLHIVNASSLKDDISLVVIGDTPKIPRTTFRMTSHVSNLMVLPRYGMVCTSA
jgi:von Willebrand factor type A domain